MGVVNRGILLLLRYGPGCVQALPVDKVAKKVEIEPLFLPRCGKYREVARGLKREEELNSVQEEVGVGGWCKTERKKEEKRIWKRAAVRRNGYSRVVDRRAQKKKRREASARWGFGWANVWDAQWNGQVVQ